MSGEGEENGQQDEEELKRYEEETRRTYAYSNAQYDRNALVLASGALGLSFAFIDKVIGELSKAHCKELLLISWVCLALSILTGFGGHYLSMRAHAAILKKIRNKEGYEAQRKAWNTWNAPIKWVNAITGLLLAGGILTLVCFVYPNVVN